MHKSLFATLVSLGLIACFPAPPDGGGGGGGGGGTPDAGGGGGDPCTPTTADGNATPGFPYDLEGFKTNIFPQLQGATGCESGAGCHGAGSPAVLFQVFSDANPGNGCPDVETFNQVVARSSYVDGAAMSAIVKKINGTDGHTYPSTGPASVALTPLLTEFVDTAKTAYEEGGGGGGGGGDEAFDRDVFASQIQPVIDNVGCIGACHVAGGNAFGNFGLTASARPGSAELEANIQAILAKIDLNLDPAQATQAKFYVKATDGHGPRITDTTALSNLEMWIATGLMGQ